MSSAVLVKCGHTADIVADMKLGKEMQLLLVGKLTKTMFTLQAKTSCIKVKPQGTMHRVKMYALSAKTSHVIVKLDLTRVISKMSFCQIMKHRN